MKRGSLLGKPGALAVFALGAAAVVWVAAGSGNAHPLALAISARPCQKLRVTA